MQHLSGEAKRPVADEWENGPTKRQRVAPGSHSNSEATDPELKVDEWAADLIAQGSGRRGPSGTLSAEPAAATVISDGTESSEDEHDSSLEIVEKDASTTVAKPELESVLWHPDPSQKAPPRWHTPIMHYTDVSNIWSIKMVNPERSYRLWRDSNGQLDSTFGALIPEGYALWNNPSYPWICPVRDCRRLCASRQALGGHFIRHRKSLLNDNRDGTFTVVGTYAEQLLSERGLPAVVITQEPGNTAPMEVPSVHAPLGPGNGAASTLSTLPSESLLPPVAPVINGTNNEVPVYRKRVDPNAGIVYPQHPNRIISPNPHSLGLIPLRTDSPQVRSKGKTPNMQLDDNRDFKTPIPGNADKMWDYIKEFMRQTPLPPVTGHVLDFIGLPRLRDIRWNQAWKNGYFESLPRDITALIMHLTGEYPPISCSRCQAQKGPFEGCIVMSRVVQNQNIVSCSNCWYHGYQTQCTLMGYLRNRPILLNYRVEQSIGPAASPAATNVPAHIIPARTPLPTYISGVSSSTSGQSQSVQPTMRRTNPAPGAQQPTPQATSIGQHETSNNKPTSSAPAITERHGMTTKFSSSTVTTNRPSPAISTDRAPGNMQTQTPAEALEMEDWEVGPGRIRSQKDNGDSIAFSNAYLFGSNGSSVAVADGISFHVDVIRPGTRRTFDRDSATTRICSLASGKLKVRMQEESELTLGPHGMFKIRPGVACTVENRIYLDCILHVSSIVTEDVQNSDE
ncbi:hypothetical protein MCOR02_006046 [Pyricularia oryzae]|uniref:Uncharacterized protein n=1 Tax=Pyricularia oryzae TaxID=318829 RepID=A0A4P7NKC9_PYROR|nr:hypothetical protein MCOR02_006046 [Pyricularia oryzae]KAI6484363.1 hypothetical protein MCOR13_010017 [Pyricularia oryzae]KAI6571445.1 hypothetical protein MCOR04_007854 [Pyricularia oryzae]QBZ62543.1 hypothetical protein PoMZ_11425 [Pyricularia oryzae]